ncbi:ligand-gated channel [Oxalicibacterium flavum]|uniref:Ligand-gated channel n=1 Tax=Oxalicibacterium flavum TaxID=179467 RepID=A0A8J2UJM0_9BURK|nr:TonB-dependent receptor [Oxalicibacterium flavum]GGB97535.1 ligand-gated channel [Oxalicibacterium flavum]
MQDINRPATKAGFRFSPLVLALHLAIAGSGLATFHVSASAANEVTAGKAVDIPAGPLGRVLASFATAHDVLLSFDPALTDGKESAGLRGSYGLQQGFAVLLAGSGLEVVQQPNGSLLLKKVEASASTGDAVLPAVTVSSQLDDPQSYAASTSNVGGKSAQRLREIPQSISVVTRQRLDEQNVSDLTTALEQTTGITTAQGGFFESSFYSRGFQVTNMQVDGGAPLTMGLAGFSTTQELAQYERIEVLRGADGLFGGAGEPGGSINLVRKRPLSEYQVLFNASAGSWNNYRTEIDVTGPLTEDGRVRGRLVATYGDREFFYDVAEQKRKMLYGIVEADLTPDTTVSAGFSLNRMSGKPWFLGLPRYSNGADIGLPRSTAYVTTWTRLNVDTDEVFAKLDQKLGDDWTLKVNLTRNEQTSRRTYARAIGPVDPITNLASTSALTTLFEPTQTVADVNLHGHFDLWGRRHEILVGGDWQQTKGRFSNRTTAAQQFDVFDFDHDGYIQPQGPLTLQTAAWGQKQYGIYGNVKLQLTDPLRLILGVRRANYSFEQLGATGTGTRYEESGIVTPYGGLVYDIDRQWSAYASIAETYKSQAANLQGPLPGTSLDPITGRNYEIGVKGELMDGKVNASAALYRIERNGQAVRDPSYPETPGTDGSNCCWISLGEVVSQGVDLELSGEIAPRWQGVVGYTYNDNENKQANTGRYSSITPKHLFKLWTGYQLPGEMSQWRIGGGVNIQSAAYVSGTARTFNTTSGQWNGPSVPFNFSQGGYAVWNARVEYAINPIWSASLNINNLFDKKYYQTLGSSTYGNWYGEPRNAMLTVRGKF